ncbi:response regulator [Bowmanella pacifica]|uniref:histidine kinase n=1 Tax=Bowmanella pacifica TaxID=502051 RepID=A0A917YSG7_9ALTE|nr:response regulator [Bowmanella pacifica]GGO65163.1 hypothetical protein GCM10010982_06310 [Bowmanella pacifica]
MTVPEQALPKAARLLLVEDDEDDYILTSGYLRELPSYSFDIVWADSPQQALTRLCDESFDICLLDFQLGAENGLSVLKLAQQQGLSTPIIMLTGQADDALDLAALQAGATDFLVKHELGSPRFQRAIRYALARKEIEQERVERLKAEAGSRAKDRFLAHLSHEIRTPLTSILGYTELLLESDYADQAETELGVILSNGKHLLSLLNDVLDLSKLSANRLELKIAPVNLDSFIADVFSLLKVMALDKGLSFSVVGRHPLPLIIHTDATRLRQVLINITYNAIKFTEQGKVQVEVWTERRQHQELLFFSVTDTGIGIAEEQLERIFQPFEQLQDVVTRTEGGAGLGLAISAELVAHMGGEIQVASELNVGSEFSLSINPGDIKDSERAELGFERSPLKNRQAIKPSLQGKVLVVDDIDEIRRLTGHLIQSTGAEVAYASNGQDVVALFEQSPQDFDLVLMDLHMPVLDGRSALTHLRRQGYTVPVVAVTAATQKGLHRQLTELGFNDILSKPINKPSLYRSLVQYLNPADVSVPVRKKILLVEDDPDTRRLMDMILTDLGSTVESVGTALDCLKKLEAAPHYDGLLMDMGLPDMPGAKLISLVHSVSPELPVCIISGRDLSTEQLSEYNAQDYLLKPVNRQDLSRVLNNF